MNENQLILLIAAILIVAGVAFAIYRNHKQKLLGRQMTSRLGAGYTRPVQNLGQR
jgi:hypothetical protein